MRRLPALVASVAVVAMFVVGAPAAADPAPSVAGSPEAAQASEATLLIVVVGGTPSRPLLREVDAADMRKELESLEKAPTPAYLRVAARTHHAAAIVVLDGAGADLWLPDGGTLSIGEVKAELAEAGYPVAARGVSPTRRRSRPATNSRSGSSKRCVPTWRPRAHRRFRRPHRRCRQPRLRRRLRRRRPR